MKNIVKRTLSQIFSPSDSEAILQEAKKQIIRELDAPSRRLFFTTRTDTRRRGDADRLRYQR